VAAGAEGPVRRRGLADVDVPGDEGPAGAEEGTGYRGR
jgi:hypothetical protein